MNQVCPYCNAEIAPESPDRIFCSSCGAAHHAECWEENRGCTVFGCSAAPPEEPKLTVGPADFLAYPTPPPPRAFSSPPPPLPLGPGAAGSFSAGAPPAVWSPPLAGSAGGLAAGAPPAVWSPLPLPPGDGTAVDVPPAGWLSPPPSGAGSAVGPPAGSPPAAWSTPPLPQPGDAWPVPPPPPHGAVPQGAFLSLGGYNPPPAPVYWAAGPQPYVAPPKNRVAFILLGIFLGIFGAHNFYAGYTGRGAIQLSITICTLFVGSIVSWIWAIVEVCIVDRDSQNVYMV